MKRQKKKNWLDLKRNMSQELKMSKISDLLDLVEKDEAKKMFSDIFHPDLNLGVLADAGKLDKDFEKFWSEIFETDVVDRSVLTSTLKKEVSTRQNMKDLEDLPKIFHQHSTDQFDNHGFIK